MKRPQSRLFALVVTLTLALTLPLGRAGQARAQTTITTDQGTITIPLPSDWVAIPTLELYLFEHRGHVGPVPPEELASFRQTRMGFQKPAEKWFTPPYLIVSLEQGRKRSPQELFMDHVLAEKDSEDATPTQGYQFLEKEQLPTKRMHYYKDTSYNPVLGKNVIEGVYTYLTSQGFLRVAWFITDDQKSDYGDTLHQACMDVKLSPELEYKPEGKK
jgi:hypothetical protein